MDIQPQTPIIGVAQEVTERPAGYLTPGFVRTRGSCWQPIAINQSVFVGCGDDRSPTEASAITLLADNATRIEIMDSRVGYASVYGGIAGQAKNALVVGAAQFGAGFIASVGGFDGIMQLLSQNSRNIQTLHSAEGNESDQRHFSFDSSASVGCVYAAGIGAMAALLVGSSSTIRDIARLEQRYVFGSDTSFNDLLRGQQAFLDHATNGQGAGFAVDREHYKRYIDQFNGNLAVMILTGSHMSARATGVISNFSLNQVGSARRAHEQNLDFYRLDIAVVTDTVLQALSGPLQAINKDYVLSPELLMRAFQLDSVPVRAVLVAHDDDPELNGNLDPLHLKIGIRGDQFSALQTLRQRQTTGYYV